MAGLAVMNAEDGRDHSLGDPARTSVRDRGGVRSLTH
jgi:hypothetical protein